MKLKQIRFTLIYLSTVIIIGSVYIHSPISKNVFLFYWDLLTQVQMKILHKPNFDDQNNPIHLIGIDDESIRALNFRWPWDTQILVDAFERIAASQPRVLAIDLLFSSPDNFPEKDQALEAVFKKIKHVVLGSLIDGDGFLEPTYIETSPEKDFVGFLNIPLSHDLKIRETSIIATEKESRSITPSFSFASVLAYTESHHDIQLAKPLVKGNAPVLEISFKKNERSKIMTNLDPVKTGFTYEITPDQIPTTPFWKLLDPQEDLSFLKDKLVFFGITTARFKDSHRTAVGVYPGVLIHATSAYAIMKNALVTRFPETLTKILFIFFNFILVILLIFSRTRNAIFFSLFSIMLLLLLSSYLFFAKGMLLDVSFSILGLWSITIIHVLYNNASAFVENMRLKNQLSFDALTNVYSYQYFELLVKTKLSRLSAEQRIVLVVFDLDNFKQINDTYGHAVGNEVLENFAALLKKHARKDDQIARFGGDEFCALLDSGENGAYHFLNRVSEDLVALNQQKSGLPKFTFSAGGAVARGKIFTDLKSFLSEADKILYECKNEGRDQFKIRSL